MELRAIHSIHMKGEFARAERLYLDHLQAHPDCADTRGLLAAVSLQLGHNGAARDWALAAIDMTPKVPAFYGNLLVANRRLGRFDEAIEIGEEVVTRFSERWDKRAKAGLLKREETFSIGNVLNNYATALVEVERYDDAKAILQRALSYSHDHADANWNLGLCNLLQGNWAEGWRGYEYGFAAGERKPRPYANELPEWHGEDIADKTILVWGEQGLGDEILFAQCLPDLQEMAGKVIVDCHPRLQKIFQRSLPAIEFQGTRKNQAPGLFDDRQISYQVPIGSLPCFFRQRDADFRQEPYLAPCPFEVKKWRDKAPGFRIGLAWRGGSNRTGQRKRSMTLETLLDCLDVQPPALRRDVQLIALQYGEGVFEEVDAVKALRGQEIHCYDGAIEDFEQQADLTASCDLVISVVQTTVHLAGAMGVKTFCLVPFGPAWKFPQGRDMIWHPSVTQYRQPERFNWSVPLARVQGDVQALLKARAAAAA